MAGHLTAIVVTFNSRKDVAACLESLQRSTRPPDEVLVLDNASADGTPDLVRRDFPGVTVLDYWDNPGFGEAHNRAFRVAEGERYFLLNPDAVVAPDCTERLEQAMQEEPRLGVAVPKIRLSREPDVLNSVGVNMNGVGYGWDRGYLEWDRGQHDAGGPVLAGSGCALMLSAAMVRAVAGFDPAYFMYYEDLDLCLRCWLAGFEVRYVPEAVALHAMKVSGRPALYGDYLDHRNRLRMVLKTLPGRQLVRALARSARFDAASFLRALARGRGREAGLRLAAWSWNLAHLRDTLRRRRLARGQPNDDRWTALMSGGAGLPFTRAAVPSYAEVYDGTLDPSRLGPGIRMGWDDEGRLGLGWHVVEESEGVRYRWSCGYGIVFLNPSSPGPSELRIVCRTSWETRLRVTTDRKRQRELSVAPGPWKEHGLPVRCEGSVVRIEIFPEPVVVPAEALPGSGSRDSRTLGLAVASLTLERTTDGGSAKSQTAAER